MLSLHDFLNRRIEREISGKWKNFQKPFFTTMNEKSQGGQSNLTEVVELVSGKAGV